MHILHVNSYYSNRFFYKHLFDRQVKRGNELDVYVPVADGLTISKKDLGNYTLVSTNHDKYDRFIYHLKHKKIVNDIEKRYEFKSIDLIHAHSLFSNGYVANELYKKHKIDYVVAIRMPDIYTFFKYMIHLRKTGLEILKNASKVVFLSESFREYLINTYIPDDMKKELLEKSVIIPNGIAPYWLENKGEPKRIVENVIKLLQVGLINKNKNPEITIRAMNELSNRGYKVEATFVGEVQDEKLLSNLKAQNNISYIARVEKEELKEIYRNHDVFILPSFKETFGLVYVEAMSQGLPVLYSSGQGFDKQYAEGQVGYSIDNTNPMDIADKFELIVGRYQEISTTGIEKAVDFNWDLIESNYNTMYLEIMTNTN